MVWIPQLWYTYTIENDWTAANMDASQKHSTECEKESHSKREEKQA